MPAIPYGGAAQIFRDFATGTSGPQNLPAKAEIRAWGAEIEAEVCRVFGTPAEMIADTTLAHAAAAGKAVVVTGDRIRAGTYLYTVVDSAATDQHLTTAGGVKVKVLPPLDLRAFGAAGDGVTDDSVAAGLWIDAVVAANGTGLVSTGDYLLGTPVQRSIGLARLAILGEGEAQARFIVPASNAAGGILLSTDQRSTQLRAEGFSIIRRGIGGVGLAFTQPEGGNQHQRSLVCRDVSAIGENNTTDRFDTFFDFTGTWRPLIENLRASGPWIGVDWTDAGAAYAAACGIRIDGAYDPTLRGCHCWGQAVALSYRTTHLAVTGAENIGGGLVRFTTATANPFLVGADVVLSGTTSYNGTFAIVARTATTFDVAAVFVSSQAGYVSYATAPEAGRIVDNVFGFCRIGLDYWRPNGREPVLWISGNHVNYRDAGLLIDGAKLVTVSGNHIYNQDTGNLYSGTAADISLKNCSEFVIAGNSFHYAGATDRIGVFVEADTTGEGDNGVIAQNLFSGTFATAIWLAAGCRNVLAGPNLFPGTVAQPVNDVSAENAVVDALAETSGSWTPILSFGGATTGITYAVQSGTYRVAGGMMHFEINLTLTSKGSAAGIADISLPASLPGAQVVQQNGFGEFALYSAMATVAAPIARATSSTNLRLTSQGAAAIANLTEANFTNTTALTICGSLRLA